MKKFLPKFTVLPLLLLLLTWTSAGVLPIFDQSLAASKFFFVLIVTLLMVIGYLVQSFKKGTLNFLKNPFTVPTFLFGLITIISIFANNRFPVESLLSFGGLFLAFSLIIGTGSVLLKKKDSNESTLMKTLAGITVFLAITSGLQAFGFGPSVVINKVLGLNLPNDSIFNLAGSVLVALQFTLIIAVGFATKVLITKKAKLWETATLIVSALASLFYGWHLLPGKVTSPIILSPTASWSVAMSAMSNLKNVLLGVGPNNYIEAFNAYRPQWLNNGAFWNIQFSQGANAPLTLLVTLGIFGLIAWLIFAFVVVRQTKQIHKTTQPVHAMLVATILTQVFMPINIVMLTLQAILVVFWIASESDRFHSYGLNINGLVGKVALFKKRPEIVSKALIGMTTIASVVLLFLTVQASYSSFLMYQASRSATNNDFVGAYSLQQQAIKLNPFIDSHRRKYSITNVVIAAAISQKTDITDEDKERFATLVQQAIREGKAAIYLDESDVSNWQTLAQVYQTLIGVADNAEEWTIRTYADAIKLAPTNPQLRVSLGGVFFNAQEYPQALEFFNQAALLKPDYANAYYNAANTFTMLKEFDEAKIAYQKTLILLQPDSDDYLRAANELQTLEKIAREEIEKQQNAQPVEEDSIPVNAVNPIDDVTTEVEAPPETAPADPANTEAANSPNDQQAEASPEPTTESDPASQTNP
jgi:cytochrome c-type biogenesis protein CcmH/NrfG